MSSLSVRRVAIQELLVPVDRDGFLLSARLVGFSFVSLLALGRYQVFRVLLIGSLC
jgi:hypothetical protein